MSVATILVIVLILILLGGIVPWGGTAVGPYHGYGHGWNAGGLILVVLLVLLLAGRL